MHDCLGPGGEGYELVVHAWFTLIKEGENVITRKTRSLLADAEEKGAMKHIRWSAVLHVTERSVIFDGACCIAEITGL
jgi:hypothetical protein